MYCVGGSFAHSRGEIGWGALKFSDIFEVQVKQRDEMCVLWCLFVMYARYGNNVKLIYLL